MRTFLLCIVVAIALVVPRVVGSHSWYSTYCCDEEDCSVYPRSDFKITPDGYLLKDGEFIPFHSGIIMKSQDGDYHRCVHAYYPHISRCFYVPDAGA